MWNRQEFGIQLELTITDKLALQQLEEKNFVLGIAYACETKLTYKTILLNGETSDTKDNVKTKINTKHMKPDTDVTHLVNTWMCFRSLASSHSFFAHTHRMAQDVRVFVSSHLCMKWAFLLTSLILLITFIFRLSFLINLKQFLLPFNFHEDLVVRSTCATSPRRWGQLTSPSPTQVLSPRTTSSQRRTSRSIRSPWPNTLWLKWLMFVPHSISRSSSCLMRTLSDSLRPLHLPHFLHLHLLYLPALPTAFHLLLPWCGGQIPCALPLRSRVSRTTSCPPQYMSPTTTSSWRLTSSPSQSPWPSNGSPSNGSSRMWITTMPQSWDALQYIPRTSLSLPATRPVCWSVVVVRVR